jgi:hypothetical protein
MGVCADTDLLKHQHPQNRVPHAIGNLDKCTHVYKLQVAFKIPYVYDYICKLCRTQAEVILNNVYPNVHSTGQGEAMHRKYKRLKLGSGQAYGQSELQICSR